jgi:hypothetical protein
MATSSRKVIYAALAGNCLIAITKSVAAFMTGSSAMLSEAIHSGADTGNQMLPLYGLRRAKLPADNEFPFGHGKEIYFWSFVVAIVLFAGGAGFSLYKGIDHLLAPVPVKDSYVNYGVIGLALIFWTPFKRLKWSWPWPHWTGRSNEPSRRSNASLSKWRRGRQRKSPRKSSDDPPKTSGWPSLHQSGSPPSPFTVPAHSLPGACSTTPAKNS